MNRLSFPFPSQRTLPVTMCSHCSSHLTPPLSLTASAIAGYCSKRIHSKCDHQGSAAQDCFLSSRFDKPSQHQEAIPDQRLLSDSCFPNSPFAVRSSVGAVSTANHLLPLKIFPAGNCITTPFKAHQLTKPNTKHHEDFAWFCEKLMGLPKDVAWACTYWPCWRPSTSGGFLGGVGGAPRRQRSCRWWWPVRQSGERLKARPSPGGARAVLWIRTGCVRR